jgi:hypothetical protein
MSKVGIFTGPLALVPAQTKKIRTNFCPKGGLAVVMIYNNLTLFHELFYSDHHIFSGDIFFLVMPMFEYIF